MRFSVLGQLEVVSDEGARLGIPQRRQRALLAVLLLHANQEMSVIRLTESLADQDGPAVSPGALRTQVWALRKLLAPALRLHTGDYRGYRLEVRPGELDVAEFRRLAGLGRSALESRDLPAAVRHLSKALALWSEPPLADVPATLAAGAVTQRLLDERRAVRELLTEARLGLGQHADLVAELREGTVANPADERLWQQLMLALHGAGRTAEALAAYQQARSSMQADLGLEPGPGLRQLHHRILAGDLQPGQRQITPRAGPEQVVPRQLPPPPWPFVGRDAELAELDGLLERADAPAVVISAIGGTAGVGKTALAVHWAHKLAGRFTDGQLYLNLRGFDPAGDPTPSAAATRALLDALGVPAERVPASLDAQAGLYRSLMAGRRILLVLDNAADDQQVRPLLPGSPGCLVIVTSRRQLAGLAAVEGAHLLRLGLLTDAEARALLAARLGPATVRTEPGAADELVRLCAGLPLALVIAAARVAARPQLRLATLTTELADTRSRLDALDTGDTLASVRAVFSCSAGSLSDPAARMFELLGLHPGPDITGPTAASLAGVPLPEAQAALAELASASLTTEHSPGRFGLHDLLRAYAAEQAGAVGRENGNHEALGRLLDHYLHTAHAATRVLRPSREQIIPAPARTGVTPERPADHQQAIAWFEAEHKVLLAAVAFAADARFDAHAWQLSWATTPFLDQRFRWDEQAAIARTALAAATRLGDEEGQAVSRRLLANAYATFGEYDQARAHAQACLDLRRQQGDRFGEARAHQTLSWIDEHQERYTAALGHAEQALRLFQGIGHKSGQAAMLNSVGWLHGLLGDYQQAWACCQQALALSRQAGDHQAEAHIWDSLGYAAHHLGRHAKAADCYSRALSLFREARNRSNEAKILTHLGDTYHAAGERHQALEAWHRALDIHDELQDPAAAEVRAKLAAADEPGTGPIRSRHQPL